MREQDYRYLIAVRVEDISKANFYKCPTCCAYTTDPDHSCPPKRDSIKINSCGCVIDRIQKDLLTARLCIVDLPHFFTFDTLTSNEKDYEIGQMVRIYGWVREDSKTFSIFAKNS